MRPPFVHLRRLRDFIAKRQTRAIVSQPIEDNFGCLKRAVDTKSNNVCTPAFALSTLIDRKVLSTKHGYAEVERSQEVPCRGALPPSDAYTPILQKSRLDEPMKKAAFSSIAGYGDASWFSPSASNYQLPFADLEACRAAAASGSLPELGKKIFSRLVTKQTLIRKKPHGAWQLGLGSIDACLAVTWPLRANGDDTYVLDCSENACRSLVTVLDPEQYEARPVAFVSPMHRALRKELVKAGRGADDKSFEVALKESSSYGQLSIAIVPQGEPAGLLQCAAREAFFNLPTSYMKEIADLLEIDLLGTSMIQVLESLIRHVLPEASDEDILHILAKRGLWWEGDLASCEDLVGLEWVTDSFDKSFADQVNAEIKETKASMELRGEFISDLRKMKVRAGTGGGQPTHFCQARRCDPGGWSGKLQLRRFLFAIWDHPCQAACRDAWLSCCGSRSLGAGISAATWGADPAGPGRQLVWLLLWCICDRQRGLLTPPAVTSRDFLSCTAVLCAFTFRTASGEIVICMFPAVFFC